jgi:hypothetical protein
MPEEISFWSFVFWVAGVGASSLGGYIWYDTTGAPDKKGRHIVGIVLTISGVLFALLAVTKVNTFLFGLGTPLLLAIGGPLLLLVSWGIVGYDIYLKKRQKAKPSKLVIHWANYRAVENAGDVFQVDDFLRQIISGDSLVFDIENHNFSVGGKNFVPNDPLPFKDKRLQVNYSYAGSEAVTTERREHGRLLLPEDSKIKWLMGEVKRLEAAQPKTSFVCINLISISVEEKTILRGRTFTIRYLIDSSESVSEGIWLGASMWGKDGKGFSNAHQDKHIALLKGRHEYVRYFTIRTDLAAGSYTLGANVWHGVVGNSNQAVIVAPGGRAEITVMA